MGYQVPRYIHGYYLLARGRGRSLRNHGPGHDLSRSHDVMILIFSDSNAFGLDSTSFFSALYTAESPVIYEFPHVDFSGSMLYLCCDAPSRSLKR